MVKIGNVELTVEEFNGLTTEGAKNILALANVKAGKSATGQRKFSINGAPNDLEGVKVTEENGKIYFRHVDYKTRSKPVADLVTAKGLIEAKQFSSTNKKTETRFVDVEGMPIGENLVLWAESREFL